MTIDKTSPDYKSGFVDGEAKGNGSAKHYMNYVVCETVCRELKKLGGIDPGLKIEKLYEEYKEKGDKIADQLNLDPIWGLYESECCGGNLVMGFCSSCKDNA